MQKVEGSSPFSRSPRKTRISAAFRALRDPLQTEPGGLFRGRIQIRYRNACASGAAQPPAQQVVGLVQRAAQHPLERIDGLVGEVDVLLVDLGREGVVAVSDEGHRPTLAD